MTAPSHLKSLQALEAALRLGSLTRAAEALAITPAAVGQRIKALEEYLGVDLLTRGRSGLAPTATLAPALAHLHAAFQELHATSDALQLQRGQEIHVAAISDIAELWLKPRLPRFQAAHPNIAFRINGEGDAPAKPRAADCELTFGPIVSDGARDILFQDFILPIGTPENRERLARIPAAQKLEGFPLLHVDLYRDDPEAPDWADWIADNGVSRSSPERGMRFQRVGAAADAVLADAGLALCGLALLREPLETGRIVLPFPLATGRWTAHAFQVRYRPETLVRPQLRRFRAWVAEEARLTAGWLEALTAPMRHNP